MSLSLSLVKSAELVNVSHGRVFYSNNILSRFQKLLIIYFCRPKMKRSLGINYYSQFQRKKNSGIQSNSNIQ